MLDAAQRSQTWKQKGETVALRGLARQGKEVIYNSGFYRITTSHMDA
jgi:hypothetical protein